MSLNPKLSLNFGLGSEFTIYPEDSTSGASFAGGNENKWIGYTHIGNSKDGWLYIGINASIGLNIETKPFLLRPTFTYHYQPETLFANVVTTHHGFRKHGFYPYDHRKLCVVWSHDHTKQKFIWR